MLTLQNQKAADKKYKYFSKIWFIKQNYNYNLSPFVSISQIDYHMMGWEQFHQLR